MALRILSDLTKWYLKYEAGRINYANFILRKQGGKPKSDDPIAYESLLSATLFGAFIDRYKKVVQNIIESNRLNAILEITYIPNVTMKADTSSLVSALTKDFGVDWSAMYRKEIKDSVRAIYYAAKEYVADSKDVEVSSETGRDTEIIDQLAAMVVLYMSIGLTNNVIQPAIDQTIDAMIKGQLDSLDAMALMEYTISDIIPTIAATNYMDLAIIGTNLARTAGRVQEYSNTGVKKLVWVVVPDEVLCARCESMDGVVFDIDSLEGLLGNILGATNHNEFVAAHPFPSWNKDNETLVLPDGMEVSPQDTGALVEAGIGLPPLHGSCYSKDTSVMTKDGWKEFPKITGEELFLSLDPDTKNLEWVGAKNTINGFVEDINVISNNRGTVYQEVSKNHPWFGYKRVDRGKIGRILEPVKCSDISNLPYEFKFYSSSEWVGEDKEEICIGKHRFNTKDFCIFLGYYLSEGSVTKRGDNCYQIAISQTKFLDKMYEDISSLSSLKVNLGKDKIYINDTDLGEYLLQFGKCADKFVPEEIKNLSREYLEEFFHAYWLGDGNSSGKDVNKYITWKNSTFRDNRSITTASQRMMSDLCEIIIKIGKSPSVSVKKLKGQSQIFKNGTYIINHDVFVIRELQDIYRNFINTKVESKPYNDLVYDVELEKNNTLLTMCNGRITWGSNCRCVLEEA